MSWFLHSYSCWRSGVCVGRRRMRSISELNLLSNFRYWWRGRSRCRCRSDSSRCRSDSSRCRSDSSLRSFWCRIICRARRSCHWFGWYMRGVYGGFTTPLVLWGALILAVLFNKVCPDVLNIGIIHYRNAIYNTQIFQGTKQFFCLLKKKWKKEENNISDFYRNGMQPIKRERSLKVSLVIVHVV